MSVTQPGRVISFVICTVVPRTSRWISVRIVRLTPAHFSGLNVHNLTIKTHIYSEVLTSWTCSSTTMKCQRLYAYKNKTVSYQFYYTPCAILRSHSINNDIFLMLWYSSIVLVFVLINGACCYTKISRPSKIHRWLLYDSMTFWQLNSKSTRSLY